MEENERLYGVYQGKVNAVRYKDGAMFIQAMIYSLTTSDKNGNEHPWFTVWAPVALPGVGALNKGEGKYGYWYNPKKDDNVLIAFEHGHQGNPYCVGFLPRFEDMPVEFDNDDYSDKTREKQDRMEPVTKDVSDPINDAKMLHTILQYILLHGKTNHMVLDVAQDGNSPDPKIELGELAEYALALGDRLVKNFLKHKHEGAGKITNIDSDEDEYYLSTLSFTRKDPRTIGETSKEKQKTPPEKTGSEDKGFLQNVMDSIAKGVKGLCDTATTADDFVNDPVGTVVDGVTDAVKDYAGSKIPKVDLDNAKDDAVDWIKNLGSNLGDKATDALKEWAGGDSGALSALLSSDEGQALSDAISSAADAAGDAGVGLASQFVNNSFDSLMDMADDAGITDTINKLGSDALGAAIDAGADAVKAAANDAIGSAVSDVVDSVPGLKSTMDTVAGICSGNLATTAKGIFGFLIDAANVATGGLLTPLTSTIKSAGGALIDKAFNPDTDSGKEQVENGRS